MILSGTVCIFTDMPGEPEPVYMEELGPGDCAGWVTALSGSKGMRAVAKTEVQGLLVMAPAFLEIARYDPALREDMFSRVRKSEVWRAVLSEMERRTGGITSAREIVNSIFSDCVTRDWPEDEEALNTDPNRIWIAAGGEGLRSGDRWAGADGVLWARLIGLPSDQLTKALAGDVPKPAKEPARPKTNLQSTPTKADATETSTTAGRAMPEKRPPVVPELREPARRSPLWKILGATLVISAVAATAAGLWASRQPTTEPFAVAGTLTFVGERRTIVAGVSGKITEWGMKSGSRIERGTILAIVQPPMDEAKVKALTEGAALAREHAEFCEGAISGRQLNIQGAPKPLAELATELARLRSDYRVLSAVERGATTDYTLSAAERQRVMAMFNEARDEKVDRVSSAARDVGARREELREAEAELREAQEEVNVQTRAFAGLKAERSDESKQELAAAQRSLAMLRGVAAKKLEVVTRLRKEISKMGADVEEVAEPADKATATIPAIRSDISKVEEQLQRHAEVLRGEHSAKLAELAKIKAEAAPRQIEALQPGLVLEAAPLAVGSVVQLDTVLGRLTTRQGWELECQVSSPEMSRLKIGQEFSVVSHNADGTSVRLQERFQPVGRNGEVPRLRIVSSRDDWRDGTPVRIEASVVTGTLLDLWLAELKNTIRK